jgi:YidC/Oxa1 family membrane protein insertase|tara:strand:+ start:883 stop:1821 length:939 start_codon:yes stop_codon:yes gene_type:complete
MEIFADIWNLVFIRPMVNSLIILYIFLGSSFGLSIISFTVFIRLIMFPLSMRQTKQMKAMSLIQPKIKAIQEKYKDDRQKISQETMSIYKQQGINPVGCLGPLIIQMPIFIGLYQALYITLPSSPENLTQLYDSIYGFIPIINQAIPIDGKFLWLNLETIVGSSDIYTKISLPILVAASTFFMQKTTATPAMDDRQKSTNRMMLWFMPLLLGYFTLSFPSGLALYWLISNVIGTIIQLLITGKIQNPFNLNSKLTDEAPDLIIENENKNTIIQEKDQDESSRNVSKNNRRSNRHRSGRTKRKQGRGGNQSNK